MNMSKKPSISGRMDTQDTTPKDAKGRVIDLIDALPRKQLLPEYFDDVVLIKERLSQGGTVSPYIGRVVGEEAVEAMLATAYPDHLINEYSRRTKEFIRESLKAIRKELAPLVDTSPMAGMEEEPYFRFVETLNSQVLARLKREPQHFFTLPPNTGSSPVGENTRIELLEEGASPAETLAQAVEELKKFEATIPDSAPSSSTESLPSNVVLIKNDGSGAEAEEALSSLGDTTYAVDFPEEQDPSSALPILESGSGGLKSYSADLACPSPPAAEPPSSRLPVTHTLKSYAHMLTGYLELIGKYTQANTSNVVVLGQKRTHFGNNTLNALELMTKRLRAPTLYLSTQYHDDVRFIKPLETAFQAAEQLMAERLAKTAKPGVKINAAYSPNPLLGNQGQERQ